MAELARVLLVALVAAETTAVIALVLAALAQEMGQVVLELGREALVLVGMALVAMALAVAPLELITVAKARSAATMGRKTPRAAMLAALALVQRTEPEI
jgi:hypothetical protein